MIEHNETYQEWINAIRKERSGPMPEAEKWANEFMAHIQAIREERAKKGRETTDQADIIHAQRVAQQQAWVAEAQAHIVSQTQHAETPNTPEPPEIESLLSDLLLIVVAHARFNRDLGEAVSRLHGLGSSGQREASAAFLGSMKVAMRRVRFYQAIAGDLLESLEEAV